MSGFVSLLIVIAALLLGLWIDSLIGQRGPATVCVVVLSVPLSLFVMVKITLTMVKQIQPQPPAQQHPAAQARMKEEESFDP